MNAMTAQNVPASVSAHVNFLRGLASWAVVANHLRYIFFPAYQSLTEPSLWVRIFYFLSSFGHVAVIAFFVLSGYWITASTFRKPASEFTLSHFFIQRISRLYIVILPGLLFGFAFDWFGLHIRRSSSFYQQPLDQLFDMVISNQLTWDNLLGSVFFVEGLKTSVFGSNSALWSLAYEFWYYSEFALFILIIFSKKKLHRLASLFLMGIVHLYVLNGLVLYRFPLWIGGCGAFWISQRVKIKSSGSVLTNLLAIFTLCGVVCLRPNYSALGEQIADYLVGFLIGLFLVTVGFAGAMNVNKTYARFSDFVSSFSFSLYVVHMPLLIFCRAVLFPARKLDLTIASLFTALAVFCFTILVGYLFYLATEKNTGTLRKWLFAKLKLMSLKWPTVFGENA